MYIYKTEGDISSHLYCNTKANTNIWSNRRYHMCSLANLCKHCVIFVRIRFPSSFGHNRNEGVCTKYTENRKCKWTETRDITWKTHSGGKNHDSPQAVNNHYMRVNTESKKDTEANNLLSSSSPHAAAVTQWRQRPLSLSLSLSLTLYTTFTK